MAGTSAPESLQTAVRRFTSQVNSGSYKDQDLKATTNAALILIRQLPVARNAVLSYFGRRFDDAANRYLQYRVDKVLGNIYNNPAYNEQSTYETLQPIAASFQELVTDKSWAPQLSKWAVDLLGHISKKLTSTNALPIAGSANTVEEKLELWMGCSATKILIEITSTCFSILVEEASSIDECVDNLLDASIRYAPHFDWVVAHLGSCFPKTIIERVLVAGYKDFTNPSLQGNTKFSSAAAILGYLSGQHKAAARKCMIDYLLKSVDDPSSNGASVVTYLLNVASLSIMVIRTITPDVSSIINVQMLNKLAVSFRSGTHDRNSLIQLAVHLLRILDQTSLSIVLLLLDITSQTGEFDLACGHETLNKSVVEFSQCLVDSFSNDLLKITLCNRVQGKMRTEVPALKHIILGYKLLVRRLHRSRISTDTETKYTVRLLLACCWQGGLVTSADILYELLTVDGQWVLTTVNTILEQVSVRYSSMGKTLADRIFSQKTLDKTLLDNLLTFILSSLSMSNVLLAAVSEFHMSRLAEAVDESLQSNSSNIIKFSEILLNRLNKHLLCPVSPHQLVTWYTVLLPQCESQTEVLSKVESCLILLSRQSKSNLSICLRAVIQHAIKQSKEQTNSSRKDPNNVSLSELNAKQLARIQLPPSRTYILHTEILAKGRTPRVQPSAESRLNQRSRLFSLVVGCCEVRSAAYNSTDAKEILSMIILELCTPDVIAAKTQWHDRITHERELAVRRVLDSSEVLWDVLKYACTYKPCFLTVSILIRCQIATLSTAWSKSLDHSTKSNKQLLMATDTLLNFLVSAQLLSKPLIYLSELLPHVACYEAKLLLDILYRYLQGSISRGLSLDQLEHDDLKTLQSIVQQNITSLAEICHKFLIVE